MNELRSVISEQFKKKEGWGKKPLEDLDDHGCDFISRSPSAASARYFPPETKPVESSRSSSKRAYGSYYNNDDGGHSSSKRARTADCNDGDGGDGDDDDDGGDNSSLESTSNFSTITASTLGPIGAAMLLFKDALVNNLCGCYFVVNPNVVTIKTAYVSVPSQTSGEPKIISVRVGTVEVNQAVHGDGDHGYDSTQRRSGDRAILGYGEDGSAAKLCTAFPLSGFANALVIKVLQLECPEFVVQPAQPATAAPTMDGIVQPAI